MSGQLEFGEEDRSAALKRAWELSMHLLATKISTVPLETYIRPTLPLSYEDNVVTLGVNSSFAKERLEQKYANALRSALEFHLDTTGLQLKIVVLSRDQQSAQTSARKTEADRIAAAQPALPLDVDDDEPGQQARSIVDQPSVRPKSQPRASARKSDPKRSESLPTPIPCLPLNDRYLFENFLIGGRSNRLAHASAMAVAARPGQVYNPLFLYGGPGLGKTHLLQAIAHSLRRTDPKLRVAYVSGEYFAQHYIQALRDHATEDFRRQYREVDVWLVDDIQFIAGKEHTKEEFFHTFNTLYQSERQIVLASDRSPRELNTMDERLRSRFQSGLIADISPPELETRMAFLEECSKRENAIVPDDVILYIADAIQSNMRTLEGALTRLVAYSSIMNAPISAELAQGVLSEYFIGKPIRAKRTSVEEIITAVAEQFGTTPTAIKGPGRNKDIALARHIAMYLCRELLPEINTMNTGVAFGGRDHATIVYAYQRVRALTAVDTELKSLTARLIKSLSS